MCDMKVPLRGVQKVISDPACIVWLTSDVQRSAQLPFKDIPGNSIQGSGSNGEASISK